MKQQLGENMNIIKKLFYKIMMASMTVLVVPSAFGFGNDDFSVNGYGYQNYRQTSANNSEGVDQRGNLDDNFLAFVMSVKISDKSRVWAQVQANSTEQTRFTWMFVDYKITDTLTAHAGRVKFPYGLINEYVDNRAMQIGVTLPTAYSGAADMVYDAYNGAGIDWYKDIGGAGSLMLQAYGGNIYSPPPALASGPYTSNPPSASVPTIIDRALIGGRLTWTTPVSGLRFMLSANQTQIEPTVANITASTPLTLGPIGLENRAMLSAEYDGDALMIQTEYNYHHIPGISGISGSTNVDSNSWYAQAAYSINNYKPFVRFDVLNSDTRYSSDPNYYQKSWVVGVNYRLDTNLNLRIQESLNSGYALPVASQYTPLDGGALNWNEIALAINFMF
jgi:hypothetical protein